MAEPSASNDALQRPAAEPFAANDALQRLDEVANSMRRSHVFSPEADLLRRQNMEPYEAEEAQKRLTAELSAPNHALQVPDEAADSIQRSNVLSFDRVSLRRQTARPLVANHALQRLAAVLMTSGPGFAMGFYCATGSFYMTMFNSPAFFIWMIIAVVMPGPILSWAQYRYDEVFDRQFSTSLAYLFRVVGTQLVLATLTCIWLLMPQTPGAVLFLGVLIGFIAAAIISSSSQMLGAMNPNLNVDANIGRLLGGVVPVAVFVVLGFTPTSPLWLLRSAILTVPFLCLVNAAMLWYLHKTTAVFEPAYRRLSYAVQRPSSDHDGNLEDAPDEGTETAPPPDPSTLAKEGEVLLWVWVWCIANGLFTALASFISCLSGFFGDAALAQLLFEAKLVTDLAGVLMAVPLPSFPCFTRGPWHSLLALSLIFYILLFIFLLNVLAGGKCSRLLLLTCWVAYIFINAMISPHIAVTVGTYVAMADRKRVLLLNVASINTGFFVGAGLAGISVFAGAFGLDL